MNHLDRVLAAMNDTTATTDKTAGDATPAPAVDPAARMAEHVRELNKTASAGLPGVSGGAIPALDKIASELATSDDALLQSKMATAGTVFMDAAMARLGQYGAAVGTKTASDHSLEAAYAKGREDLEKEASDAYAKGQEVALQEIHKTAAEFHYAGQVSARNVIAALSQEA